MRIIIRIKESVWLEYLQRMPYGVGFEVQVASSAGELLVALWYQEDIDPALPADVIYYEYDGRMY